MSAKNPLPINRHFDCMTKCQERIWGCMPTCERLHKPVPPVDELQRLRAENAQFNLALQATYDERQEVLGELRADNASLRHDIERYVAHAAELATEVERLEGDAGRFQALQNMDRIKAQAFFFHYQSRKQRAAAIDATINSTSGGPGESE